jgi:predicted DsbA family dithiol-disulfide isomerase
MEGIKLKERASEPSPRTEAINARISLAAKEAGLPLSPRFIIPNTRLAHELGKWAQSIGKGDEFHLAVFRAYFGNGKDIGKISTLTDIADQLGLSKVIALEVLDKRSFKDNVDSDWTRSLKVDPDVIPSVMINEKLYINPQKYSLYEQFMAEHHVKKRNPIITPSSVQQ